MQILCIAPSEKISLSTNDPKYFFTFLPLYFTAHACCLACAPSMQVGALSWRIGWFFGSLVYVYKLSGTHLKSPMGTWRPQAGGRPCAF